MLPVEISTIPYASQSLQDLTISVLQEQDRSEDLRAAFIERLESSARMIDLHKSILGGNELTTLHKILILHMRFKQKTGAELFADQIAATMLARPQDIDIPGNMNPFWKITPELTSTEMIIVSGQTRLARLAIALKGDIRQLLDKALPNTSSYEINPLRLSEIEIKETLKLLIANNVVDSKSQWLAKFPDLKMRQLYDEVWIPVKLHEIRKRGAFVDLDIDLIA